MSTGLDTEYLANGSSWCVTDLDTNAGFWSETSVYNCTVYYQNCYCSALKADPDIAGYGVRVKLQVLVAFGVSAFFTVLFTIVCLILIRYDNTPGATTYNPIDKWFRRTFSKPAQDFNRVKAKIYSEILFDVIVTLSDQQLVTGIAMLLAGIIGIRDGNPGSMSVYHFSLVSDLAWLSSNTHLASLLVVRAYRNSRKPKSKPESEDERREQNPNTIIKGNRFGGFLPRSIRIVLMAVQAMLLLYCSYRLGNVDIYVQFRCPIACTDPKVSGGVPRDWKIVNFVLILYAYPFQIFQSFETLSEYWNRRLRPKIIDHKSLHSTPTQRQGIWNSKACRLLWPGLWYFLASETVEIAQLIVWFILGIYWVASDRVGGQQLMEPGEIETENRWGFGQLVPLVLLILPLIQFLDSYEVRTAEAKEESEIKQCPHCQSLIPEIKQCPTCQSPIDSITKEKSNPVAKV